MVPYLMMLHTSQYGTDSAITDAVVSRYRCLRVVWGGTVHNKVLSVPYVTPHMPAPRHSISHRRTSSRSRCLKVAAITTTTTTTHIFAYSTAASDAGRRGDKNAARLNARRTPAAAASGRDGPLGTTNKTVLGKAPGVLRWGLQRRNATSQRSSFADGMGRYGIRVSA